jgi:predicted nuclease of predicted toxin-antitoxin system
MPITTSVPSRRQARIVFSKDADFVQSHLSMQTGERIASKAASANKEHLPQLD